VAGGSYDFAAQLSVPFYGYIGLLVPSFFGDDAALPYWGPGGNLGGVGLRRRRRFAARDAGAEGNHPQRRFWTVAAVLALLLVLGKEGPLFRIFYEGVPGVRLFRPPGRYYSVFTIALTVLAAAGADACGGRGRKSGSRPVGRHRLPRPRRPDPRRAGDVGKNNPTDPGSWPRFVAARLADPDAMVTDQDRQDPAFPDRARAQAAGGLGWAAGTLALSAVVLLGCARGLVSGRVGACVLGTILIAELALYGRGFMRPHDPTQIACRAVLSMRSVKLPGIPSVWWPRAPGT